MTVYLHEILRHSRTRPTVSVLCLTSQAAEKPRADEILLTWPFDGTEKRRQEILRFIEKYTDERGITIGNPELWSLPHNG